MKVLAGIVLYNPEPIRIKENIDAIHQQVDTVLLIENGSTNKDYKVHLTGYDNILYIDNHASMGIAYALNQICGYAYTHGYEWALTLDQDSIATPGMVDTYKGIAKDNIGIIGCYVEDRNFDLEDSAEKNIDKHKVYWVITSGSFMNTKAWKACGGFDTTMFIEWVDWDIGEAVWKAGFEVWKTNKTKLIQEIGNNTKTVMFLRRRMFIENHVPMRTYYVSRNRIYMARKYKHIPLKREILMAVRELCVRLLYEKEKIQKMWACTKGFCDGFFMKPKYEHITQGFLNLEAVQL